MPQNELLAGFFRAQRATCEYEVLASASSLNSGTVIGGKYRLDALIGRGGMGVVWRATHLTLGGDVALKILRVVALTEHEARRRFIREARALFALKSPHTVRLLDVSEFEEVGLVMVMEFVRGRNVSQVLRERQKLPQAEAVRYAMQVCRALTEAHEKGIIHRDIKPANLLLTEQDGERSVKVLDFGLAKAIGEDSPSGPLTTPAATLGTPRYMAPEQWLSAGDVDARCDIFSLGVVLHQMLTGKVPLEEVPLSERPQRLLVGVPSPRDLNPEISPALARVVLKALRPVRQERYGTAREFEEALAAPPESARSLTTTVGHGRRGASAASDSVSERESEEDAPRTEREPGWDLETRPQARPAFEVNVYTGARLHEPPELSRPKPPSVELSPDSSTHVSKAFAVKPPPEKKSNVSEAPPAPVVAQPVAPKPAPARPKPLPPVGDPTPPPVAIATPPRSTAPSGSSTAPSFGSRLLIAVIAAFALGVALAFALYSR